MSTPPPPGDPRDALFDTSRIMGELTRRTGYASVLLLAMSLVRAAQQIVVIAVLGRLIPPAEYGIFALALPGVLLAMSLSSFGLPQAIVQRREIDHETVSALFWLNILFSLIATAVVVALAWPAAAHFNEPRLVPVYLATSLAVLFSAMGGQYIAILRRTMRVREIEVVTFLAEMVAFAAAIVAALAGLSYWALVIQQILAPLLMVMALVARTGWRPSAPHLVRYSKASGALVFGGFVAAYSILNQLTNYAGTLIAGSFYDSASAGLFYRARNLTATPQQKVTRPLSGAFVPALSRLQDDPAAFREMYARTANRTSLILIPIGIVLMAGSEPLTLLLLGREWVPMAPLMFWMSLMIFRLANLSALQSTLMACGESRILFLTTLLRFAAVCAALYFFAPRSLVAMTAAYALTETILMTPVMAVTTVGRTPLDMRTIFRATGVDTIAGLAIGLAFTFGLMPRLAGMAAPMQVAILLAVTGIAFGLRVVFSPVLRREVMRVAERILSKLTGRKPKKPR